MGLGVGIGGLCRERLGSGGLTRTCGMGDVIYGTEIGGICCDNDDGDCRLSQGVEGGKEVGDCCATSGS